jgi:hypothetical protein
MPVAPPASLERGTDVEFGERNGQEALQRLQQVIRPVASADLRVRDGLARSAAS